MPPPAGATPISPIQTLFAALPLATYFPLRHAAATLPRASRLRQGCVLALKSVSRANRGGFAGKVGQFSPIDAPQLSFSATDSMVMEAIYWFGVRGYEGMVPTIWTDLCRKAQSVLEVGGNVGLYAVIGGSVTAGRRYTVVEPVPEVAAVLAGNLLRNGITHVEVLRAAAIPGATETMVRLSIPTEAHGAPVGSHLVEGVEVSGRASQRVIEVAGLPFRDLVRGRDVIKLDAEGIEAELLLSARDVLAERRPTLLIEMLPEARRLGEVVAELARSCGYRITALPEYGHDDGRPLDVATFESTVPSRCNAKDVLLTPA